MDHPISGHGHEGEIPIPITSSYVVHHHHSNNINNNFSPTNNTEDNKKALVLAASSPKAVRYRECLKNHAASMGGTATDGCGEFMPSGEEGSLEALKCSACGCHRNFHRKEVEGELPSCYYKPSSRNAAPAAAAFLGYMPRQQQQPQPPALIMPLGAIHTSESDEIEDGYGGCMGGPPMLVKRRFRTKFTVEQKEKMLGFAEQAGWKLQRQEEGAVQQFCQEIGVKRRVLKVWMHNNKHSLAKKSSATSTNNISTPPQIQ